MENLPFVSIVTVCYNSKETIVETIESVLNQTYNNFEYIIIDGLSQDGTIDIAENYKSKFADKKIRYKIISEKDYGIYDAMNKGIENASGQIVGLINSDDYYEVTAIEEVVKFYKQTNFDIMYADLRVFGERKEFVKKSKKTRKFSTRYWNHPTTFVTKKVYEQQKYACQSIYDDLNFMLSAIKKDFKIEVLNKVLANFRLGGISNEKSVKLLKKRIKLRNKIYKQNGCKGYLINNFAIEVVKFLLA